MVPAGQLPQLASQSQSGGIKSLRLLLELYQLQFSFHKPDQPKQKNPEPAENHFRDFSYIALVSDLQAIKVSKEEDHSREGERESENSMAEYADVSYRKLLRKQMLAGGLAGMLADAVMYPMMTVKSRMMVQGGAGSSGTAALYMYKGPVDAIYTIGAKEGMKTLYKGFSTVTLIGPAQALYMATYQTSKRYLPGGPDNPVTQFGGGVLATLVQSSVMVPTEVIRQRQQIQPKGEGAYTGSVHAVKTIVAHEGFGALYRGFLLAQLVWGPYNAVYLPLWEANKRLCVRLSGAESVEKLGVQYELGSAFVSSAFAAGVTNPMDVIKTRLQVQGKKKQYDGAWDAAKKIYRHEGFRGFAGGISSRMLWVAPSATIMFTTYDQLMKRLNM